MITKRIIYTLPNSVTTQRLKGKNIKEAFKNLSAFLINCTTCPPESPSSIKLSAFSASGSDDPQIGEKNVADINDIFGAGVTTPLTYAYPSGKPSTETQTEWKIENNELEKALIFLIAGEPWPKYTFGPVELIISYDFNFIDPDTKEILPNQMSDTHLIVWLSRTNSCSSLFYFPFKEAGESFDRYITKIEPYLPFKFERKHLRTVMENKDKGTFVFRKI